MLKLFVFKNFVFKKLVLKILVLKIFVLKIFVLKNNTPKIYVKDYIPRYNKYSCCNKSWFLPG